jgi:hypothetical protein
MRVHLYIVLERKEALEKSEDLVDRLLRDGMVLDVEEATCFTRFPDLRCDGFLLGERAIELAHIDRGDGREARGRLGYLSVCGFGARVEVHVFVAVLRRVLSIVYARCGSV